MHRHNVYTWMDPTITLSLRYLGDPRKLLSFLLADLTLISEPFENDLDLRPW